jgi:hypothetical protein
MSTRIQNIELGDETPAALPTASTPAPVKAGEVSDVARARVLGQQADLAARGYTKPKGAGEGGVTAWSGLAIGTRVNDIGDKNLALSRQKHDDMPAGLDALGTLRSTVVAEGRTVVDNVALASILCRYNPAKAKETGDKKHVDGAIALKNGDWHVIDPTPTALGHLAAFLTDDRGAVAYMPNAPARVRAAMVEEYRHGIDVKKRVSLGLKTKVESKLAEATTCYRVASPGYTPYEVDRAASDLLAGAERELRGTRAEVLYDGEHARLTFFWHADEVVDLAAGDVFKVGLQVHLDDVRAGSVKVRGVAIRNKCLNLIILGTQSRTALRRRHTGEVQSITRDVLEAVRSVRADFSKFIEGWQGARRDRLVDAFDGDPRKVFEGLVGAGLVDLPGRKEQQVENLMAAWEREPGYTRADVVNAITRAAHEGSWWSNPFESEEVEAQAGKLLYVSNLVQRVQVGAADFAAKTKSTVELI